MHIERLDIPDILLVKPIKHGDQRGFFSEIFRADAFRAKGVDVVFVQDNHSILLEGVSCEGCIFSSPHAHRAS